MTVFEGLYLWRGRTTERVNAPEHASYQRFPYRWLANGAAATWINKQPAAMPLGIRLQELVPGGQALPDAHGIPGITIPNWGGAWLPNYNSDAFLSTFEQALSDVKVLTNGRILARLDAGIGKWGEGHWYGSGLTDDQKTTFLPTPATYSKLMALWLHYFPKASIYSPTDNRPLFNLLYAEGIRRVFADGFGFIASGANHFERHWRDAAYGALLDTCDIATERGHETRTNLNYTWMRDSMLRHPNITAVSNDWPGLATLAAPDRALINEIITLANDRRTVAPPPPTGDLTALRAELADTKLRLAQCEVKTAAATTRAATLTTSAQKLISANTAMQTTYAELVALLAATE